jgi:hypothetical protein
MQSLVQMDSVLTSNNLILPTLALLHHRDCCRSFAVQEGHDAALAFFVAAKGVRVSQASYLLQQKGLGFRMDAQFP